MVFEELSGARRWGTGQLISGLTELFWYETCWVHCRVEIWEKLNGRAELNMRDWEVEVAMLRVIPTLCHCPSNAGVLILYMI